MISFNHVYKVYEDKTTAVKDVTFDINSREFVTVIGPSGCGKTTLLKMINRLIEPTSGSIAIDDKNIKDYNIHELRWNIGYVLQEIALFPHLTIEENISVVPEMKKWSRKKMKKRSKELMNMVGLDPMLYAKRMPDELSGGEQQRIGVLRALAADPNIILMDEPFSALDPISRAQLQNDIREIQKKVNKTVVFVTHDIDEALALGDRVCLMKDGQVVQYDTPQNLITHPENGFVEQFIGEQNFVWQTSINLISSYTSDVILSEKAFNNGNYTDQSLLFLIDDDGMFVDFIKNGERIDGTYLLNEMTLYEATRIMHKEDQQIYPVLKDRKFIGTLTYKDIATYLYENAEKENEVIQS